jgi:uncharacterized protein YkwD
MSGMYKLWMMGLLAGLSACAQPPAGVFGDGPERRGEPLASPHYRLQQRGNLQDALRRPIYRFPRLDATTETAIFDWVNAQRRRANLAAVERDQDKVLQAAREHSWQMALHRRGFLTSPDGKGIGDRLNAANAVTNRWYGYAWGPLTIGVPHTMAIYATAKLDRQVLLDPNYKTLAVAVYRDNASSVLNQRYYTTLIFAN